jgi:uncharacterized membrane protein YeiH
VSPVDFIREIELFEADWRTARASIELSAIASGSLSGALHGIRREFDIFGVVVIAVVTGLGGGIVRDLLLAQGPVLALRHPNFLLTALAAAGAGILIGHRTVHLRLVLWILDALALGLFTVTGIQRAEEVGLELIPALLLGVLAGTGSGLLRDIICRETPAILVPGKPYATAALLGGLVYQVSDWLGWPRVLSEWLAIASSFGLRALGSWRGWIVPQPQNIALHWRRWFSRKPPR